MIRKTHSARQLFKIFALLTLVPFALVACDSKSSPPSGPSGAGGGDKKTAAVDHDHAGHDHDHDHKPGEEHADSGHADHGPAVALGEQTVDGLLVKASRDGELAVGGEAPVDVWISGEAKPTAVRFWIGTQDAKGSVKAKAELERDNWHTHVEVPSPLPEGSKLWVEIETAKGKSLASFALAAPGHN